MPGPISIIPPPPGVLKPVTGAWMVAYLSDPQYDTDVQVAPDSAGAPDTAHEYGIGPFGATGALTCVFQVNAPNGVVLWVRARQTAPGKTPSAYTPWRKVLTTVLTGTPPTPPDGLSSTHGGLMFDSPGAGSAAGTPVAQQVSAGGGLLPNGEFDLWNNAVPVGWAMDSDVTVAQELSFVFSGKAALKLSNPNNATNGGWHGSQGPFVLPLRPGVTYRIKASVATSRIAGGQRYRLTLYTKADLSQFQNKVTALAAINAYQTDEWVVTVPTTAQAMSALYVEVSRNGDATATDFWVDAVRVEEDSTSSAAAQAVAAGLGYSLLLNPSAEDGSAYWKTDGTHALNFETSTPYAGTQSFKSPSLAAGANAIYYPTTRAGAVPDAAGGDDSLIPVSFGDEIRARMAMKTLNATAGSSFEIRLRRFDRTKALIDDVGVFFASGVGTAWSNPSLQNAYHVIGNASVAYVQAYVKVSAVGSAETFTWDDVVVQRVQGKPRARIGITGAVSVANATPTIISWNDESGGVLFDSWGMHDPATNPSRITLLAGLEPGVWRIAATVEFAASAAGTRVIELLESGTVLAKRTVSSTGAGGVASVDVEFIREMPPAGAYYEVRVTQSSGGALNADAGNTVTYFEVIKLS